MVYIENETKMSWSIRPSRSLTKTLEDNNVINRIGLIYAKIETKLSGPLWLGAVYDANLRGQ